MNPAAPTTPREDFALRGFTFSFFTMTAIITSYFPLYFQYKGYSTVQIGLLYSVGPLTGIVSNLFWGLMSDKYQTVKKILLLILIGQLIVAFFMFRMDGFALLMVLMAGFFFFQQPMTSLNDSLVLLTVSGTRKSYASFRVWGSIGFAAAALVFGELLRRFGAGLTPALALGSIIMSLSLASMLRDARDPKFKRPSFSGFMPIVMSRPFLAFLIILLIVSTAQRMNDGFLALYLQQLGASPSIVGWAWMTSAVSEIPVFFLLSKYGHRYKELPLLAVCSLVYIIRFLLMMFVENPVWAVAIQLLHSISFGILLFTAIRYIQSVIPDQYRASGQAIFAMTWSGLAGLISGTLGGWIFNTWSPRAMYGTASALAVAALLGFLVLHARQSGPRGAQDFEV
ncbi:MFS transporter, PPP family, 3-phenylpropionic acid transporter [Paenibacillus sp. UNCCL117]|uniref:MFS transporter n=1 Tax=unclassified Paenibacillus TaxID=185978 RepID=UPI000885F246|nr:MULTISPECIES: MFS transporter [unclassified Paenibacillus]SDC21627.1 MFS transporter, PPP family, 3-phenylpropionic acid transporter [Paenibacillus sp. cl123]SFW18857.1 MFS transporter, PPP family, 3-phenylpropionic acid transporter [Paenibacillus sp. UNCCL117]